MEFTVILFFEEFVEFIIFMSIPLAKINNVTLSMRLRIDSKFIEIDDLINLQ